MLISFRQPETPVNWQRESSLTGEHLKSTQKSRRQRASTFKISSRREVGKTQLSDPILLRHAQVHAHLLYCWCLDCSDMQASVCSCTSPDWDIWLLLQLLDLYIYIYRERERDIHILCIYCVLCITGVHCLVLRVQRHTRHLALGQSAHFLI